MKSISVLDQPGYPGDVNPLKYLYLLCRLAVCFCSHLRSPNFIVQLCCSFVSVKYLVPLLQLLCQGSGRLKMLCPKPFVVGSALSS